MTKRALRRGRLATRIGVCLAALATPLIASCSRPATAIVLAIGTDARVPEDLDAMRIVVTRGGAEVHTRSFVLPNDARLPGTLTLYDADDEDPSDPLHIEVAARRASQPGWKVERAATLGMVAGDTKLLRLKLERSCFDVKCVPGETCIGGSCRSDAVDVASLPPFVDEADAVSGFAGAGGVGGSAGAAGAGAGGAGKAGAAGAAGKAGAGAGGAGAGGAGAGGAGAGGASGSAGKAGAGGGGASGAGGGGASGAGGGGASGSAGKAGAGGGGASGAGGGGASGAGGAVAPGSYPKTALAAPRYDAFGAYLPGVAMTLLCSGLDAGAGVYLDCLFYDAGADAWLPAADTAATQTTTCTLLPDGRLVAVYGYSSEGGGVFDAAVSKPLGSWTVTGPLSDIRASFPLVTLDSGKVLLPGGNLTTTTADVLDPGTGVWTPTAPMVVPRRSHAAVVLQGGDVLVIGGTSATDALKDVERFDGSAWTAVMPMQFGRDGASAVVLADGRVAVFGGTQTNGVPVAPIEIYDPGANTWVTGPDLLPARAQAPVVPISGGRFLIAGGMLLSNQPTDAVQVFDPAIGPQGTVTTLAPLLTPRRQATVIATPGGVLVVGGKDDVGAIGSVELVVP